MQDNAPIYETLFEMEINLCERFSSFSPLSLRREKAREVFLLLARFSRYSVRHEREMKHGKKIKIPAGDNWF